MDNQQWLEVFKNIGRRMHAGIAEFLSREGGTVSLGPDPDQRAVKVANLEAIVAAANDMGLPVNIGTEMNKAGLPFVDDLAGPVLSRFRESFLRGARIMVGHSILLRYARVSYVSAEGEPAEKNRLFESVGALPPLTAQVAGELAGVGPDRAYAAIRDAAGREAWR